MERKNRIISRSILVLLLLSIILYSIIVGEKVPLNDGAGWDGAIFRNMASSFWNSPIGAYNSYSIQRIFPFVLINLVYVCLNISIDNASLMLGMHITNVLFLVLGIYFFFRISDFYKYSVKVEIIAFVSLFFNVQTLKFMGYMPFITDYVAVNLAIILFYYFLTKQDAKMLIVGFVGAFNYPTYLLITLCLYVLPRVSFDISNSVMEIKYQRYMMFIKSFFIYLLIPLLVLIVYYTNVYCLGNTGLIHFCDRTYTPLINEYVLVVSCLCTMWYIYRMLKPINFNIRDFFNVFLINLKLKRVVIGLLVFFIVKLLISFLADPNATPYYKWDVFAKHLVQGQARLPFLYIETRLMYLGLVYLLIILNWKRLCKVVGNYGFGYIALTFLMMIFSVDVESRRSFNLLPFILFPLCEIFNNAQFRKSEIVIYVSLSLLFSMFWFNFNVPGIKYAFENWEIEVLNFPAQRYFMFGGTLQSNEVYIVVSSLLIILFCLLCIGYKKGLFKSFVK
ncbi:hypothetical protein [Parabacteroides bouchesdurhonensis]|uniref:hypothetical protein n=1 Tax=Parabacteroides bouchesdurhonensis TaxID=1936995 RepID=UPI000E4896FE|nr:hypothetical protein [Parabacteroides bouchesdurhonensis]RHJ94192.1 hypothetical protein DW095_04175 [Bacteroides sp. AM07-16]